MFLFPKQTQHANCSSHLPRLGGSTYVADVKQGYNGGELKEEEESFDPGCEKRRGGEDSLFTPPPSRKELLLHSQGAKVA